MLRVMTKTMKGSPDGISVLIYEKGNEYDLPLNLVRAFEYEGACDIPIEKMIQRAPENKMVSIPNNKVEEDVQDFDPIDTEKRPAKRRK